MCFPCKFIQKPLEPPISALTITLSDFASTFTLMPSFLETIL